MASFSPPLSKWPGLSWSMTHFWMLAHPPLGYISWAHSRGSFIYSQHFGQQISPHAASLAKSQQVIHPEVPASRLYKAQARESPGILHLDRVAPLHCLHQRPQSWLIYKLQPRPTGSPGVGLATAMSRNSSHDSDTVKA